MGTPTDPPKPPPELEDMVDRVLAYRPKGAKPVPKPKRTRNTDAPIEVFALKRKPPTK